MSHSHNSTKTSAVTSVITTEQSAVILNNVHCYVLYWLTSWRMIIDQANAAAESNGRFFLIKRIDSNRESECSTLNICRSIATTIITDPCVNNYTKEVDRRGPPPLSEFPSMTHSTDTRNGSISWSANNTVNLDWGTLASTPLCSS